jgi:NAD(P)-dependent dehydrogenase (short-subunit alcohol dehydrogenase family)
VLAEAGAGVVIASRKIDSCEAAAAEIRSQAGGNAVAIIRVDGGVTRKV